MAQKMTLTAYLAQRGVKAKALTKGEASLLGIPYPLQSGWPRKYGTIEISEDLLELLEGCVKNARRTAGDRSKQKRTKIAEPSGMMADRERVSPVTGFVLRRARRCVVRKPIR